MAGLARCFALAISIKMVNIVDINREWSAPMGFSSLAKRSYFGKSYFGKELTPNQVDLILHAAILAASFLAVALAAALGAGSSGS